MMQKYALGSIFYLFYTLGFVIYFVVADLLKDKVLYSKIPVWVPFLALAAYSVRFIGVSGASGGGIAKNQWLDFHVRVNSYMYLDL